MKKTAPRQRVFILAAIFIVTIALTVLILPTDPLIAARLHEIMSPSVSNMPPTFNPDASSKMDIALGSPLPAQGAGREMRARELASAHGYLVVSLGDCATCSRFDDKIWQKEAAAAGVRLIGFAGASPQKISESRRVLNTGFPIYIDPSNGLHNAIRALC